MKIISTLVFLFLFTISTNAQEPSSLTEVWKPEVRVVDPGLLNTSPPSDAIVLFDGKNTSAWLAQNNNPVKSGDGSVEWGKGPIKWKVEDGVMTIVGGSGYIITKQSFGDCQIHIEWRTPDEVKGNGQGRGNSGIFFMGKYELQVLDSYNNPTYSNGQAGSIYKQLIPLVNSSRKPGQWQTYDVVFMAPIFNKDGNVKHPATVTVFQNGVLVQNHATIFGSTEYIGIGSYHQHEEKLPLLIQDHGNPVSYRNIWIREL
ncbi:MAG: DUF1080 domain-containing protein [Ginsengibacter sp.]